MPTLDNRTINAIKTDVGFKISKPGFDANKSIGSGLVFSSSWPSLNVIFETTITNTITGLASPPITVPHGQTFACFGFVWAIGPDNSGLTGSVTTRRIPAMFSVDGTNVYLGQVGLSGIETNFLYTATKLHIKCFEIDLSKDVDYVLAPGDTFKSSYDNSFGVKVVKPNKDINSKDLRDFTLHSRCQSALILAVKTQDTNDPANPTITQYTSKYKDPVWVYGFTRSTAGKYRFAPLGGQSYPLTATNGFTTSLQYQSGAGDNGATLVILRDPMFAATSLAVTY